MNDAIKQATPLIAVDIGNSSTRLGRYASPSQLRQQPSPDEVWNLRSSGLATLQRQMSLPDEPCCWHVASVCRTAERELCKWVAQQRRQDDYRLLCHSDLPLAIDMESPERVGLDRLAAAVGAVFLREGHGPVIVVNAGTAITVDLVDGDAAFQGGVILPGFQMAATALAQETDLLPMVQFAVPDRPPPVVGKSTEAAIQSGLFWGSVGAVRETVERVSKQLDRRPELFVTGGDAVWLARSLDVTARYVPDLVLLGIAASRLGNASRKTPAVGKGDGSNLP